MGQIPGYRDDKFMTIVNESEYYEVIIKGLHREYPDADEAKIEKMARLEFDIMFILRDTAYYQGKFHYMDQKWITQKLREFGRIADDTSADDILSAIDGNTRRFRIFAQPFNNCGKTIYKYIYQAHYKPKVDESIEKPVGQPPARVEVNPFVTDEYKMIMGDKK